MAFKLRPQISKLGLVAAPEIVSSATQWINSYPLSLKKLRGKIVLLDFWTFSCVNCVRSLNALKQMHEKYKDNNVVIIGIHTPEFDFEKDIENVKAAVKKHGLKYPVLNDPERINWEKYGNTYWPRSALIDTNGKLISEHIGESGYDKISEEINEELSGRAGTIKEEKRMAYAKISPEIYAGSLRANRISSTMACTQTGCEYFDPDPQNHVENYIYLKGKWKQEPEYLEFEGGEGYLSLRYYASEVNVVMNGNGATEILLNDEPVKQENTGLDATIPETITEGKKSFVHIDKGDMYNIIQTREFKPGELKIIPFKGLKIYAFTFG